MDRPRGEKRRTLKDVCSIEALEESKKLLKFSSIVGLPKLQSKKMWKKLVIIRVILN